VIVRVVLGPYSRRVESFGTGADGRVEERAHGRPVLCHECDVVLTIGMGVAERTDPERRSSRAAVADHRPELENTATAERRKDGVVEPGARVRVRALDRQMIEHAVTLILAAGEPSETRALERGGRHPAPCVEEEARV